MKFTNKNTSRITEEPFASIIREEYQEAKRRLNPLLSQWHFSSVKFYWQENKTRDGGWCAWFQKKIYLNHEYRDAPTDARWTEQMFRMCLRHEIAHLVYHNHGGMFLRALELLEGHRYVGHPAYSREQKVKPTK